MECLQFGVFDCSGSCQNLIYKTDAMIIPSDDQVADLLTVSGTCTNQRALERIY
jgi:hypothetical protein